MRGTKEQHAWLAKQRSDFRGFAERFLDIKVKAAKGDQVRRIVLNEAQCRLLEAVDRMLAEEGLLRIVFLKARQTGGSTFFALWLLWIMLLWKQRRAVVMAHRQDSAPHLAEMVRTAYRGLPGPMQVPVARQNDSVLELATGSRHQVMTAGSTAVGRSFTFQYLHGSEVSRWEHASEHVVGIMDAVADGPGTAIVLESTAMGATGAFHDQYRAAEAGETGFRAVFLPWHIEGAYRMQPPDGFSLSGTSPGEGQLSEREYAEAHGLDLAQMAWRRRKMAGYRAAGWDPYLAFGQEYPATPSEAFLGRSGDSYLSPLSVQKAVAANVSPAQMGAMPVQLGVDVATSHGPNDTALILRKGPVAWGLERHRAMRASDIAHRVYAISQSTKLDRILVDRSEGVGDTVCHMLWGWAETAHITVGVKFGEKAPDPTRDADMKSHMYREMGLWLDRGACIPDEPGRKGKPTLASELLALRAKGGHERLVRVESKDELRSRGVPSPDGADALALTFAFPDVVSARPVEDPAMHMPVHPGGHQQWQEPATGPSDWLAAPW